MTKNKLTLIAGMMIFASSASVQSEPYVYPAKGQSTEQMEKDKYACYGWGKQQTGYDPMNPSVASSGQANTTRGIRGKKQQQQQAQQQSAATAQMRSEYDRAYSVCLEGRGYNVK